MIQPLVTIAQYAEQYATLNAGQRRKTIVYYKVDSVDYHSAISLFKSIDDQQFIICGCGCAVRQLTHYDDRPGLCCADCLLRERHKADGREARAKGKTTKPVTEVKPQLAKRRETFTTAA